MKKNEGSKMINKIKSWIKNLFQRKSKKITKLLDLFLTKSDYEAWRRKLSDSSRSKLDASVREKTYDKVIAHQVKLVNENKTFLELMKLLCLIIIFVPQ